jgi:DNA polymerase V
VSIGLAPTKTLAKVATHIAKKNPCIGIYDLRSSVVREIILKDFPAQELWGVGRQWKENLAKLKIETAAQLCDQPMHFLKKKFSVMMTRLVCELKGISCISLEETHNKKNIMCSRSFGKPVTELSDISEAISCYAASACEKARKQKSKAQGVCVYLRTSPFSKTQAYYSASEQQTFSFPSNDTVFITKIVNDLIQKIVKPNLYYQKVGVILLDLVSEKFQQNDFFEKNENSDNQALMSLLDGINQKWGSHHIFLAAEGMNQRWQVKQVRKSPRYTTSWNELPCVSLKNK